MKGRLIYLIGPSGSGKDSLLDAVRERSDAQGCRVARRVITRSAEAKGELAEAVSPEAFAEREERGEFAMSWYANGLSYGIPRLIDDWLETGDDVLVNGSRGYLPEARRRYPHLLAVLLTVEDDVLRRRLHTRGRESAEEIEARLARNTGFADTLLAGENADLCLLDNSGSIAETCQRLLQLIEEHRPVAWPDSA
ncbi:phosphonate metabolism protein/1,5-bisphosphokinase (PRPP-forming) PhnN [Pseudomonas sp. JS3066]|jgi:ribose 1,5-bisphosphokinase|uniref:phosphonate metabolism protein/1,5-bisphosphokinase (PRPP-forming) PhnN n=1 Tax=unclassified Pseudomonas TaxID=196821 RepID=UPI000EA9077B|nr:MULTISPECIES: phosphonate metabolism protein/1,5-bisphosphokinase (PRPP-forming) PhnN [unclassified Pseudomonas]AYF87879.1 phosphonate metabolism protein/1,5-bisphosphokinase (PRPP-forming) PhnN [Pseudomonas sp. DY-1]MDH4655665.1 phosphonate metabolism protein/1,5-bisphosphokinase (PRPP-forming) PhnN [Pseudomonas sp. BN606]MRK21127.1 phosphonate metabolism protein/1,5-bisphosphokinase (PRPP-forming) PhnN [Pseudomonas sp. JG-B]WVK94553.1 phosphonate metabolism protein/1,5-bisphosphokinase (PR